MQLLDLGLRHFLLGWSCFVFCLFLMFPSLKGKGWKRKRKRKEETGKRKGKGGGKGEKNSVSHGPFLMPKVIVFVIVLLAFVNPLERFTKWSGRSQLCIFAIMLSLSVSSLDGLGTSKNKMHPQNKMLGSDPFYFHFIFKGLLPPHFI